MLRVFKEEKTNNKNKAQKYARVCWHIHKEIFLLYVNHKRMRGRDFIQLTNGMAVNASRSVRLLEILTCAIPNLL